MALAFELSEYQKRLLNVKERMSRRGVDALVIADPANMNYLTGYDGWSFYVPQAVIVVADDPQPYWIGRRQDSAAARLTTWLDETHIESYPESYVQAADHHPAEIMADLLRRAGCTHKTIGVELDAYYLAVATYQKLVAELQGASWVDGSLVVNWARSVKSPAEIAYMREAAKIATHAMEVAAQGISVGTRECDAAADIFRAQIAGVDGIVGDYPAIVPLVPSQERTCASHLTWVDRRYEPGDMVSIELAGCSHRYHAPLCRTVVLGPPPLVLADLAKAVVEGVDEALAAVRPGALCADVEAAWRKVISRYGYTKESRLGYSVGCGYPPDWGEHTASLRAGDRTELQPNMAFHMIAGMWMDDYGIEISETIVVTPRGCEVLTQFPRDLIVKHAGAGLTAI